MTFILASMWSLAPSSGVVLVVVVNRSRHRCRDRGRDRGRGRGRGRGCGHGLVAAVENAAGVHSL